MSKNNKLLEPIDYYFNGFFDSKEFSKFVKTVVRAVRSDRSYSLYIEQLRDTEININRDVVLNNLRSGEVTIELHHHPLTLYDIVSMIALHNYNNDKKFSSITLTKEVIKAHYDNLIGLTPLSTTTHDLAHSTIDRESKKRYINLSRNQIFGKYEAFVEKYKDGLTLETREKLGEFEEFSSDPNAKIDQKDIFK